MVFDAWGYCRRSSELFLPFFGERAENDLIKININYCIFKAIGIISENSKKTNQGQLGNSSSDFPQLGFWQYKYIHHHLVVWLGESAESEHLK